MAEDIDIEALITENNNLKTENSELKHKMMLNGIPVTLNDDNLKYTWKKLREIVELVMFLTDNKCRSKNE